MLSYFRKGCTAQPYWTNTSSNSVVRSMIARAGEDVNAQLTALAGGGAVEATLDLSVVFGEVDSGTSAIWPQLYLAGYVTTHDVAEPNESSTVRRLEVPNLEVARPAPANQRTSCDARKPPLRAPLKQPHGGRPVL